VSNACGTIAAARPVSLRRNLSWTATGNIAYAGSQWAMIALLAKFGTPDMVGQFAFALALTAPAVLLSNLALRLLHATDAKNDYTFGEYLGLRMITISVAAAALITFALAWPYGAEIATVIIAVTLAKAFESTSDIYYGFLQKRERMDRVARSLLSKSALSLMAWTVGIFLTGTAVGATIGLAAAWLTGLLLVDRRSARAVARIDGEPDALRPSFDGRRMWLLTRMALPLGLGSMLISFNTNLPRYFIQAHLGPYELGIFAAMAYVVVAGNTVIFAIAQSVGPRLSRRYAEGDLPGARRLFAKMLGVGVAAAVLGVATALLAGDLVLSLLYTPEYAARSGLLALIMVAGGIGYVSSLVGAANTAARCIKPQLPLELTTTALTAGLCYLWVPAYGLTGAAWALAAAAAYKLTGSSLIQFYAVRRIRASLG
jgi:O-antigen/teichoic acid export membrane protein